MDRDVKDIVGTIMSVLNGAEVTPEELDDLTFEADGYLETVLNEAYVKLHEFVNDRTLRHADPKMDRNMRSELQDCLNKIVTASNSVS
jgi:hypothetical protein